MATNAAAAQIRISDATPVLAPALLELERRSQLHPWSLATFLLELARPNRIFLAAQNTDDSLVGYACGWIVAGESQLHNLVVDSRSRRLGLGREIAQQFIERSRAAGAETIVLEVRMANLPAIALYRRLGFSIVGWRPGYYDAPHDDACMMTLGLKP